MWTQFSNTDLQDQALALAKGSYQQSLVYGHEAWSGSTLRGKAKQYAGSYSRSRDALLQRMSKAGIKHHFEVIERRKILVVGN